MVWNSLESWFDLLMVEVQKLENVEITQLGKQILEPESEVDSPFPEPEPDRPSGPELQSGQGTTPSVSVTLSKIQEGVAGLDPDVQEEDPPSKRKPLLQLPLGQPSKLAAAIVQSTPIKRRAAFLKSSSSVEEPPLSHFAEAGEEFTPLLPHTVLHATDDGTEMIEDQYTDHKVLTMVVIGIGSVLYGVME